jgi:hypothetical protein
MSFQMYIDLLFSPENNIQPRNVQFPQNHRMSTSLHEMSAYSFSLYLRGSAQDDKINVA